MLEMDGSVTRDFPLRGRVAIPAAKPFATRHANNPSPSIQGLRSCITSGSPAEVVDDTQPFPIGSR